MRSTAALVFSSARYWFEHYDIRFLAGHGFRESERRVEMPTADNPVTHGAVVLNESAARRFDWSPEDAAGKIALAVAWITIAAEAGRAARSWPVLALGYE